MRVRAVQKPFKRTWLSTLWVEGTVRVATTGERTAAVLLFLASAGATLTISVRSPLAAWAYAFAALAGACWWTVSSALGSTPRRGRSGNVKSRDGYTNIRAVARDAALVIIAALGAVQWITGATVYRYATLEAWTRAVALGRDRGARAKRVQQQLASAKLSARVRLVRRRRQCDFCACLLYFARKNLMDIPKSISRYLGTISQSQRFCGVS